MSKARLLITLLSCGSLLGAGCGSSASGSNQRGKHHPKLVRTPWARLLITLLSCGSLLGAGCGSSASGSNQRGKHHPKLVRTPWEQITRGSNPRTLLIDTVQGTTDRSGSCFIHYTTRVVRQTSRLISIEMVAPETKDRRFQCTARAVRGPFFVPVHLKKPYRGESLLDPVTGRFHRLIPRTHLH